jgi:hypothetical protein
MFALPGEEPPAPGFTIRLVEARDLQGTQNPYAEVSFGTDMQRTRVQTGGGRIARWNQKFKFEASDMEALRNGQVKITVGDENDKTGR